VGVIGEFNPGDSGGLSGIVGGCEYPGTLVWAPFDDRSPLAVSVSGDGGSTSNAAVGCC